MRRALRRRASTRSMSGTKSLKKCMLGDQRRAHSARISASTSNNELASRREMQLRLAAVLLEQIVLLSTRSKTMPRWSMKPNDARRSWRAQSGTSEQHTMKESRDRRAFVNTAFSAKLEPLTELSMRVSSKRLVALCTCSKCTKCRCEEFSSARYINRPFSRRD